MLDLLYKYLRVNYLFTIVAVYFLLSTSLNALTDIDVCIPCLWKTIFNVNCPGCGLTRAFINLLKLDFKHAFEMNKFIFIILPLGIYYLLSDLKRFKQEAHL